MRIENAFIMISLSCMFISILLQVIMRYIFGMPLVWSEEVARYLFVYFSFIGISFAIRENSHIRMVVVINLLPERFQKIIQIVLNLLIATMFLWLVPQSIPFLKTQLGIYATATKLPIIFVYAALPIGFVLSGIRLIMKSIEEITEISKRSEGV
jgi:C4-dicarboxylate transporter DctQ subunit